MKYFLEYSSNEKVMENFGPKLGVSLFYNRPVSIQKELYLKREGEKYTFMDLEGNVFLFIQFLSAGMGIR